MASLHWPGGPAKWTRVLCTLEVPAIWRFFDQSPLLDHETGSGRCGSRQAYKVANGACSRRPATTTRMLDDEQTELSELFSGKIKVNARASFRLMNWCEVERAAERGEAEIGR